MFMRTIQPRGPFWGPSPTVFTQQNKSTKINLLLSFLDDAHFFDFVDCFVSTKKMKDWQK